MGDAQVRKSDESNACQRLAQQFSRGREYQYVVDKSDRHDSQQTDHEELALAQLVVLKEEVCQHEAEIDIQSADIRYFARVAHSFIWAHDKAFLLRNTDHERHSDEAENEADEADEIAMGSKKILYHCGSNCS